MEVEKDERPYRHSSWEAFSPAMGTSLPFDCPASSRVFTHQWMFPRDVLMTLEFLLSPLTRHFGGETSIPSDDLCLTECGLVPLGPCAERALRCQGSCRPVRLGTIEQHAVKEGWKTEVGRSHQPMGSPASSAVQISCEFAADLPKIKARLTV